MTSPEQTGLTETRELQTALPSVTVRTLKKEDLSEFKDMVARNSDYFDRGGIFLDGTGGLYEMAENEITTGEYAGVRHRMGIFHDGAIVGFISVVPAEDNPKNMVEVAYAVDEKHARRGIAGAAIEAVVEQENDKGNTVIAEVELNNEKNMRLLRKLGFEASRRLTEDRRKVYIHKPLTLEEMVRRHFEGQSVKI